MAKLFIYGAANPFQQFLRAGLTVLGHTWVAEMSAAEILILSPLEVPGRVSEPSQESTLAFIETLPTLNLGIQKLIFLSSPQVYGEGDFTCGDCGPIPNAFRTQEQMGTFRWELLCPICGEMILPLPIQENSAAEPTSLIGQQYRAYECALLRIADQISIPVFQLRVFAPYWPEQSFLDWPDAGVLATFTKALLMGESPGVFEEGYQMRDFTYGQDVVQVLDKLIQAPQQPGGFYNISSGERMTLIDLVAYLQEFLGKTDVPYNILEQHREGDVRHRFANIDKTRKELGYQPKWGLLKGLEDFAKTVLINRIPVEQSRS
jgi:dTDP-L-rhamnose 4-epimerase